MPKKIFSELLSHLPSVDQILQRKGIHSVQIDLPFKVFIVRRQIEAYRKEMIRTKRIPPSKADIADQIGIKTEDELMQLIRGHLKPVINATGIILHTNLGRAPFSAAVASSWQHTTRSYCDLEFDLVTGKRGERDSHVENLLRILTGAESALVVNNNAAAVLLTLNTLARNKKVIISRGELIEVGGGFRIPEVIERSGAVLQEVGTTNKTRLADYHQALRPESGVLFKAHYSNYRVVGFTEETDLKDLVRLGKTKKIPVVYDLGSGVLLDLKKYGFAAEPVISDTIRAGVDLVLFSGDKILGGPQCGIIVGKKRYIDRIRENHLLRALRCDKMVYAILESTLKLFLNEKDLLQKHPVMKMLTESAESVKSRAEEVANKLKSIRNLHCSVEACYAQAGSGTLPLEKINSWAVVVKSRDLSVEKLSSRLREMEIPIIGYVTNDKLYLDMRTVFENDVERIHRQFHQIMN